MDDVQSRYEQNAAIRKDLSKNMALAVQRVVSDHCTLAASVLQPGDIAIMLVDLAAGTACGAMLFAVENKLDEVAAEQLASDVANGISVRVVNTIPIVLEQAAQRARAEAA